VVCYFFLSVQLQVCRGCLSPVSGHQHQREVNRITFKKTEANPGDELDVSVPKLHENEVLVPGSLALVFDIDISGGHANNFLVQNVTRALVERLKV